MKKNNNADKPFCRLREAKEGITFKEVALRNGKVTDREKTCILRHIMQYNKEIRENACSNCEYNKECYDKNFLDGVTNNGFHIDTFIKIDEVLWSSNHSVCFDGEEE